MGFFDSDYPDDVGGQTLTIPERIRAAEQTVREARVRRAQRSDVDVVGPEEQWIDLGCGSTKISPDALGVDMLELPGVDLVGPIPDVLDSIAAGTIDGVYSHHFLEHVDDVGAALTAVGRILRPTGRFIAVVPHFSNPHYYSDPTHRTAFGLYSMSYFAKDPIHRRAVPNYRLLGDADHQFELRTAELRFDRSLRQPFAFLMGRLLQAGCQRSVRFREWYERRCCWLFPCSEIRFELRLLR